MYTDDMPFVRCKICKNEFYAKPYWLKNGWGKYCSQKCQREGQKTGKFVNCFTCGKTVYKSGKSLRGSKSKKYFCNKSCQTIWRNTIVHIGPNHPNWRGGHSSEVYRNILRRSGKKERCTLCKTKNKRVLAAHHIDHNHKNNRPKNLTWLCHNCHFLVHHYEDERIKLMETLV